MPKAGSGGELDSNTQTYIDCLVAIDCLHILYSEYIKKTSASERELIQLYLGLKGLKEKHAMAVAEQQAKLERDMARTMQNGYRA